jgi:polyisoprenoid-binding protein YceI
VKRCLAALAFLLGGTAAAHAGEFLVRPGGENKVVFVSKAAMERFEGKTSRLEGRIFVDPAGVGDSIGVHLEVDMATLDTGIALRNRHMRENHLDTDKYPRAVFEGATVLGPAGAALEAGRAVTLDVEGTFTLHGVSRRMRISVEAVYTPRETGGRIEFRTTFPVTLADYGISRPQFLFLKLAEAQTVRVTGVALAAPASGEARP